jgi:hypothetical protein
MSGIRDAEAALAAVPAVLVARRNEQEVPPVQTLPRDHPHWVRDTISISSRARALLERVRPAVIRVLSFWDHAVRSVSIGGYRLSVDPSGSYRVE